MAVRDDFGIFILAHGRPESVVTANRLAADGYSGRWWLVCDDEDPTLPEYQRLWGDDRVKVFHKSDDDCDMLDNGDPSRTRSVVVYARNATEAIAQQIAAEDAANGRTPLAYYMQCDDDYTGIGHRYTVAGESSLRWTTVRDLDTLMNAMVDLLIDTDALTVAMAQGGDWIGGLATSLTERSHKRKAMNTFVVRVGTPVGFLGRINEDVNTYVLKGSRGEVFLTAYQVGVSQRETQKGKGGMTDAYTDHASGGTYLKSFYSVVAHPAAVSIGVIAGWQDGFGYPRVHHRVEWNRAVPKIVPGRFAKPTPP